MKTTAKDLKIVLKNALLNDGKMEQDLYEYEFEELLDELLATLIKDKDDFVFAITTHKNDITDKEDTAMVLIDASGKAHINELARDKLKEVWEGDYERRMTKLIPDFAKQLYKGDIPISGIKTVLSA
ncbi:MULTISPECIES: hypothetical protein [Methylobacter]|uniref:hypothetical protein n=1 Tax=Methylobacter TaxID=429 RepID=UPI001FAD3878|nr:MULTISPECIES: hypothetical protein [Methylobacter]UOA10395.1 hypothetical protein KKZ03_09270 [Methylobacter sp. S3L5C]